MPQFWDAVTKLRTCTKKEIKITSKTDRISFIRRGKHTLSSESCRQQRFEQLVPLLQLVDRRLRCRHFFSNDGLLLIVLVLTLLLVS